MRTACDYQPESCLLPFLSMIAPVIRIMPEINQAVLIPKDSAITPLASKPIAPQRCGAIEQNESIVALSFEGIRLCKKLSSSGPNPPRNIS